MSYYIVCLAKPSACGAVRNKPISRPYKSRKTAEAAFRRGKFSEFHFGVHPGRR